MTETRTACIILCDDVTECRREVGRALRAEGFTGLRGMYLSRAAMRGHGAEPGLDDPRYNFECTDAQLDAVLARLPEDLPIDVYHD